MKMKKIIGITGLYALPLLVLAQTPFLDIVDRARNILDAVVPFVITLALIYFIYGVAKYTTAKGDEGKEEARDVMIYGAIALFVIVSIWGIVGLLQTFTGTGGADIPDLPSVPLR